MFNKEIILGRNHGSLPLYEQSSERRVRIAKSNIMCVGVEEVVDLIANRASPPRVITCSHASR